MAQNKSARRARHDGNYGVTCQNVAQNKRWTCCMQWCYKIEQIWNIQTNSLSSRFLLLGTGHRQPNNPIMKYCLLHHNHLYLNSKKVLKSWRHKTPSTHISVFLLAPNKFLNTAKRGTVSGRKSEVLATSRKYVGSKK